MYEKRLTLNFHTKNKNYVFLKKIKALIKRENVKILKNNKKFTF